MSWKDEAACRGLTGVMFSDNNADLALALKLCESCPVRADCLAECMATEDRTSRFGVCGGVTAPDRYRLAGDRAPRRRHWRAA